MAITQTFHFFVIRFSTMK